MPQESKLLRSVIAGLAIIPACLTGRLIWKYGVDAPYWDQWEYASFFEKLSDGTLALGDLFAQQNEYRQFFPNLIFVGLGWLTKWDVRYELLVSFLLACLVSFNVYHLGKVTVGGGQTRRLTIWLLANLLIFSPVQHENWMVGMQLIYFLPVACVTTCLVIAYSEMGAPSKFLSCMCLATISTFSSANGILCWAVVLPLLVWANPRRELTNRKLLVLAWGAGFVVNAALYFNGYRKPPHHPDLATSVIHPVQAAGYFFSLMGKSVATGGNLLLSCSSQRGGLIIAAITGLALAGLFVASTLPVLRDSRSAYRAAGWLSLGAYSIMTGLLVTFGRAGFGVGQSLTSRYTTFTLYLPVALIHLLPIILERRAASGRKGGGGRLILLVLAGFFVSSQLLAYPFAAAQMRVHSTVLRQGKACLLFINVLPEACLAEKVYPNLEKLRRGANVLNRLGFLRPGLISTDRVQDIAAPGVRSPERYGSFTVVRTGEDEYVASGWAVLPERGGPADAVLLTYDRGNADSAIFALAGTEEGGANSLGQICPPPSRARWEKSFNAKSLPAVPLVINAWAFDARTGKAFQLAGTQVVQHPESAVNK